MIDLLIEKNDLVLSDDGNAFKTISNSIGQEVYITFSVWLKNWFYDQTFGIDYQNFSPKGKQEADLMIKSKLLSISGVVSVISFMSTYNQKTRFYAFEVVYKTTDSNTNTLNMEV